MGSGLGIGSLSPKTSQTCNPAVSGFSDSPEGHVSLQGARSLTPGAAEVSGLRGKKHSILRVYFEGLFPSCKKFYFNGLG